MDYFIKDLKKKEPKSIAEVMAFISYNPSIGRVLKKGGVKLFRQMVIRRYEKFSKIKTLKQFDRFHNKWISEFMRDIKTSDNRKASYGHAQKAINVFLKTYVDWASKPARLTAKKLRPFLHVPLDKILMKAIKNNYPDFYNKEIKPLYKKKQTFSLSKINKKIYYKWQFFFRKKYPRKPLLFDIAWAIRRNNNNN